MIRTETLDDAFDVYFAWAEENGLAPKQPDRSASDAVQGGWELVNCNGVICYVTDAGEVVQSFMATLQLQGVYSQVAQLVDDKDYDLMSFKSYVELILDEGGCPKTVDEWVSAIFNEHFVMTHSLSKMTVAQITSIVEISSGQAKQVIADAKRRYRKLLPKHRAMIAQWN